MERHEIMEAMTELKLYGMRAYSDEAGHLFRHEAGHRTDLKPATIPT